MKRQKPPEAPKRPRNPHAKALASKVFRGRTTELKPVIPRKAKHRKPPETDDSAD